jgi:RNA polymerase sigma-70 factor (ECF subfamily)
MTIDQHDSITRLYVDHQQWLQSYLQRQLSHQRDIATDLVQDTFLSLIEKPQALSEIREQRAFLLTIAKRKLFNFWRKQDLEQAYLQSLSEVGVIQDSVPVEQLCLIKDALYHIDLLLDGLKPTIQHAFLLKKLELLTHPEIALRMQVSLATVERYIKQATIHCIVRRKMLFNDH